MLSVQRVRERLPLIAFILLLVLLLMLIGFACACLTDHPMQLADRAISTIAAVPAVIVLWTLAFGASLAMAFVVPSRRGGRGRASPAELQRFLF